MPTNNIIATLGFRQRVKAWMLDCFGITLTVDKSERNQRFLEEALELVQSLNMTREQAHQMVDYVFNRPVGEPGQEAAGTMVSLAALCSTNYIDLDAEALKELERIGQPEMVAKIRIKQAAKPRFDRSISDQQNKE